MRRLLKTFGKRYSRKTNSNLALRQYFSHPNGEGGTPHISYKAGGHVMKVSIWLYETVPGGTAVVVAVGLEFADKTTVRHGGEIGTANRIDFFDVASGDYIVEGIVHGDWGTHGIEFVTNNGIKSDLFGGSGPITQIFKAGVGEELCGMSGRAGALLDKVTFLFGKRIHLHVKAVYCWFALTVIVAKGIPYEGTRTTHVGMTSNDEFSGEGLKIAVLEARAKITSGKLEANMENLKLHFLSTLEESILHNERHDSVQPVEIRTDGESGVYMYEPCVRVEMSNGDDFTLHGKWIILAEPLDVSPVSYYSE
jgi:hypothetical protein